MKPSIACATIALAAAAVSAGEIGFEEEFALAPDRAATLSKLVPGSEDFYYYSCLVAQQKGDSAGAANLLKQWRDLHGETQAFKSMEFRQRLLDANPDDLSATADALIREFDIRLNHAREEEVPPDRYPAALDPAILDHDAWLARALSRGSNLGGFTPAGIAELDPAKLDDAARRTYLSRLSGRTAGADFCKVVAADLRAQGSQGFGSHSVHGRLLLADLDALAKEMPELLANDRFVYEYSSRLLPDDPAWTGDTAAHRDTLARLVDFAKTLPASQNSFKAHVFYHALDAGRAAGEYDDALFAEYLALPREAAYINPKWRNDLSSRGQWQPAALPGDFLFATGLPPVGSDERLVRDFVSRQMLAADGWQPFAAILSDDYAKALFAETKLLAGIGEPDSWYALLPPGAHAALRDRVDIELLPDNPAVYAADVPVSLSVAVKNVSRLTVQVFEIDTFHYFRDNEFVSTDIDLDGLAPTAERVVNYDLPPLRRHAEKIDIPEIKGRGLFVVELIGDTGVSSRAVIRRGRLFAATRPSSAGTVFTVLDETLARVPDARVWYAGREFAAGDDGDIVVPFVAPDGTSPFDAAGMTRALLRQGDFTDTTPFSPSSESYSLSADFVIDREEVVAGERATLLVRPTLLCSSAPASASLIDDAVLRITSHDADGVETTRRIQLGEITDAGVVQQEFAVPEGACEIIFELAGRVRNIALGRDEDVDCEGRIYVNGQDLTTRTCAAYLRRTADGAFVEVRGKSGEPVAGRVLQLEFHNRFFTDSASATLQTDAAGRVALGALPAEITMLSATLDGVPATWSLATREVTLPDALSVAAGERIELPNPGADAVSLFRLANGAPVSDASAAATVAPGFIAIDGLEPGEYLLAVPSADDGSPASVHLSVCARQLEGGLLAGASSVCESDTARAPRIDAFEPGDARVRLHIANATPETRLHLLARWSVSDGLPSLDERFFPDAAALPWPASSLYVSGRTLGDEVRYVLERRFAETRPGNMLARPSLLLRPWEVRSTSSARREAQAGDEYDRLVAAAPGAQMAAKAMRMDANGFGGAGSGDSQSPTYDFLPGPALVAANLAPDDNGDIFVDRDAFGFRTELVAMLDDGETCATESFALPDAPLAPRDRALANPLPADRDVAERKDVVPLVPGEAPLAIADPRSARIERIDTVSRLYSLFRDFAVVDGAKLAEFAFVADWDKMDDAAKRAAYAKYACHELDVFIYFKDRPFFDKVVAPLLANIHAPDFIDDWLLGRDLAKWLEPAAFDSLNAAEKALLARGNGKDDPALRTRIVRLLHDASELRRIDPAALDARFRTALGNRGLEENAAMYELAEEAPAAEAFAMDAAPRRARALANAAPEAAALGGNRRGEEKAKQALADGAVANGVQALRKSARMQSDKLARGAAPAFYRSPEQTKEWAESRYYRVPRAVQDASLVQPDFFWRDAGAAFGVPPFTFLSTKFIEIHDDFGGVGFTGAMFALALLDLPFEAEESPLVFSSPSSPQSPSSPSSSGATLAAKSPMLVVHSQIVAAEGAGEALPLLVSESFFDPNQTITGANGEPRPRPVTDEFVAGRPYTARVVVANPTDDSVRFSLLTQIPEGAIPVANGAFTRDTPRELAPYSTQAFEYDFYFPHPGDFAHYAAHASRDDGASSGAAATAFHVVAKAGAVDDATWESVSQRGTDDQVLAFIEGANALRLDLGRIAFRMRDKAMFERTVAALRERCVFNSAIWGYGFMHRDAGAMREWLARQDLGWRVGPWFESALLSHDAAASGELDHFEYWPLVNARAHALGGKRRILNDAFSATYAQFLRYACHKPALGASDRIALAVLMLLQDRVDDAAAQLAAIDPAPRAPGLAQADFPERVQYDYLRAYMAFCASDPEAARKIATKYADYPVDRWNKLFAEVVAQADEIKAGPAAEAAPAAASAPFLALEEDDDGIAIHYANVGSCVVRYYPMDLELLFSRSPFAGEASERFAMVRPARSETIKLAKGKDVARVKIPDEYRARNMRIEIEGDGATAGIVHTPNTLVVRVSEASGSLLATDSKGRPIAGAYVKVYARWDDGSVRFYKDGYTDLRGRFDYAALSTDDLAHAARFALLVATKDHGALIRESAPPTR